MRLSSIRTRSARAALAWIAVAVATLLVLFAPRPAGDVAEHLHKEDGSIFLAETLAGDGITTPYTGYQHWAPRVVARACSELTPGSFSRCVTWSSHGFRIVLALATFVLLLPMLGRRAWAALVASMFIFVPMGQQEVLGNLTNLRWFADAFGVVVLSVRISSWRVAVPVAAIAAMCALTDPLALLIAPLALWHLWRPPRLVSLLVPISYAAATLEHWILLDSGARDADIGGVLSRVGETAEQLLVRGLMVAQFGQNGSEGLILVVGLPLALLACLLPLAALGFGLATVPSRLRPIMMIWLCWGTGLLLVTISFADSSDIALTEYWRIGQASRYSVIPAVLIGMALVVSCCAMFKHPARHRRLLSRLSLVVLFVAVLVDSPGDGWNVHGPKWRDTVDEATSVCEDGRETVTVLVTPTGVPTRWDAVLPCSWIAGTGES